MDAIHRLAPLEWEEVAATAARGMARGIVSKFQPCLPKEAEDRLLAGRLLDLPGTHQFLGSIATTGVKAVPKSDGDRIADVPLPEPLPAELLRTPQTLAGVAQPKNPVLWIDTAAALGIAVDELLQEDVVGLDVETTLDFGTLCLIQLATRSRTYIIDPFAVGDLGVLGRVLGAATPQKVIHNARFERGVLAAAGVPLDGVFDTLDASRRLRGADCLGGHSLAMVCERELGVALDKSVQRSNWCRRPLDAEQIRYAAVDVERLIRLYRRFSVAAAATSEISPG